MNIKARFALSELIARWSEEFELSLEDEIELLEKQLSTMREAQLVIAMDGYSPEEKENGK